MNLVGIKIEEDRWVVGYTVYRNTMKIESHRGQNRKFEKLHEELRI